MVKATERYNKVIRPSNPSKRTAKTKEIVTQAISSSGFTTDDAAADRVNPEIWDRQLRRFVQTDFDLQSRAELETGLLDQAGDTYNVTIDKVPNAASAVAETDDVTIQETDNRQVTYSPTEYGTAFQVHDREIRKAFFDVMANFSQKVGYSLRLNRERTAVDTVQNGATHKYFTSGSANTDIASSDTLAYEDLVDAVKLIRDKKFVADRLYVTTKQFADLAKSQTFELVDHAGTSETLRGGRIGEIYGMTVYEHNELNTVSSNVEVQKGLILGMTDFGDKVFGFCPQQRPTVRTEREELGRYTNIVGVEEWDMQMLRPDGAVVVSSA